jgi:hypothetical protein
MAQKKSYTAEQKVLILRELLENKVPINPFRFSLRIGPG